MKFFKSNKEIKTENLKLSDFDKIWTKFCFLDETGSLSNPDEPLFTIGIMKMSQPYYLLNKISFERDKRHHHDEMKFNKISKNNLEFAKFIVDILFETQSIDFYSYTIKKDMNKTLGRLALAGVCRFNSKSNDLLQVVDLVIGIISYDLKLSYGFVKDGSIYKRELIEYFKKKLGVQPDLQKGFRNHSFNIFVDKDTQLRLPILIQQNEKGLST